MNDFDVIYKELVHNVFFNGEEKQDRTGTGTISLFGTRMEFDVSKSFPLLTTKKIHWKSVVYELLWMLKGGNNITYLNDNGVSIWDEWADEDGDLGPIYGEQWRRWPDGDVEYDQIIGLIAQLQTNPNSRRHIVSAWNVPHLPLPGLSPKENAKAGMMALAPCHLLFQVYAGKEDTLDLQVYQRSADIFLGVPFNIASYAALLYLLATIVKRKPNKLIWVGGDTHLYLNHVQQAQLQLSRIPKLAPTLSIQLPKNYRSMEELFNRLEYSNFILDGYNPHPAIQAPIAI